MESLKEVTRVSITKKARLLIDKYFENYSDTDIKSVKYLGYGKLRVEMKDFNGKFEIEGSQRGIAKIIKDYISCNYFREGHKRIFDYDECSIYIQYKDGTDRYISEGYDASNLKLTEIKSVKITNPESDILYGDFSISKQPDGEYYSYIN